MKKNIGNTFLAFCCFFIILSCSNDENIENISSIKNDYSEVVVNGKKFEIDNIFAYSMDLMQVEFSCVDSDMKIDFYFKFTPKGTLRTLECTERIFSSIQIKTFGSELYKSNESIEIKNLEIDNINHVIKFDFDGKVISNQNLNETRKISGKIKTKFQFNNPNFYDGILKYNGSNLVLNSMFCHKKNMEFKYNFYTNNGYWIEIDLNENIWEKNYFNFNINSIDNKVNFKKAIPPFHITGQMHSINQPWISYKTEGNVTITNKYYIGSIRYVSGIINLIVKDTNNNLIFNLENIYFESTALFV